MLNMPLMQLLSIVACGLADSYSRRMANYHAHASVISRSKGKSACAHSAYITGDKVKEERTGKTYHYRKKSHEVFHTNLMVHDSLKHKIQTGEQLWNFVERHEDIVAEKKYGNYKDPVKQAKSLAAKERYLDSTSTAFLFEVSLPLELKEEEMKELSDLIAKELFVSKNLNVQYACHDKKGNPHVHYMVTFRPVIEGKLSRQKFRFKREDIKDLRKITADVTNGYAKEKGYDFVVDHRSYKDQGLEIKPTKHLGWMAKEMGETSRIFHENQEVISENTKILLEPVFMNIHLEPLQ